MLKRILLIILVLFSFTLNVNAENTNSGSIDERVKKETTPKYTTKDMQEDVEKIRTAITSEEGWTQNDIYNAYKRLKNAGIDTGEGWFFDRSLEETKPKYTTKDMQEDVEGISTAITSEEGWTQNDIDNAYKRLENAGIDTGEGWFSDRSLEETKNSIDERVKQEAAQVILNYQKTIGKGELDDAEFDKEWAESEAEDALKEQFDANSEMKFLSLDAAEKKEAYEKAKKKTDEANKVLEDATDKYNSINNNLSDAIDRGDLAEAEKLRGELDDAEFDKEWAESEAEDALKEQFDANSEMTFASLDVAEKKEVYEKAKKKTDEANKVLEDKKKTTEECKVDLAKCGAKSIAKDEAIKQADDAVNKSVENLNTACADGYTPTCVAAIQDMRQKEADKACLEPNSDACSVASKTLEESKKMTAQSVLESKIKAEKAAAEAANLEANPGLKSLGSDKTMKALLGITDNNVIEGTEASSKDGGFTVLSQLTVWFKNNLSGLVQILSVGAFLFVGIRLGMARGNPEEFKKALMHMIYVILGIFIITVSWAAVVLVAGINI